MALKIQWTKRAIKSFDKIVEDIEENWSEASAKKFVQKTNKLLEQIAENPEICQKVEGANVKRAVITKQSSVYYRVFGKYIRLVTFWDNRRDPYKLKL